ncbi:hypothetical protein ACNKHO_10380 [Shigella flexneri]
MMLVVIAALPGILAESWVFLVGTLIQPHVGHFSPLWSAESLVLRSRSKTSCRCSPGQLRPYLLSGFRSLSVFCACAMVDGGRTVFAVIIAKQLYGGFRTKPFQPSNDWLMWCCGSLSRTDDIPKDPPHDIAAQVLALIDLIQVIFTGHTAAGQDMMRCAWHSWRKRCNAAGYLYNLALMPAVG